MEQIQSGSPVKVVTSKGVLNALQVVITAGVCVCDCCLYVCVIVCLLEETVQMAHVLRVLYGVSISG